MDLIPCHASDVEASVSFQNRPGPLRQTTRNPRYPGLLIACSPALSLGITANIMATEKENLANMHLVYCFCYLPAYLSYLPHRRSVRLSRPLISTQVKSPAQYPTCPPNQRPTD